MIFLSSQKHDANHCQETRCAGRGEGGTDSGKREFVAGNDSGK